MSRRFGQFLSVVALVSTLAWPTISARAITVDELRQQLEAKKANLKSAEEQIAKFKDEIALRRQQARTLNEQIQLIEDGIEEMRLNLAQTQAQIEETNAEIDSVQQDIADKEAQITAQKQLLSEYLRALHILDQQSNITIFLKYRTFAEAVQEASTVEELQNRAQDTLTAIQKLRDELDAKERELEDFKQTLEALRKRQQQQQQILTSQRDSKARILDLTNKQEKQFQGLLAQEQATHKEAEAQISSIDSQIREELRKQGFANLPHVGTMDWPVDPVFGVSCEFHCDGYPFAYLIGPHSGTDIPESPGTPIKAPADGYVAKLHDAHGPGYSYILLIHGDNISTVYGHVSGFATQEGQVVTRGTVIGYTGGVPGANGAGLSSGPHLHFEVRENNIPVNARNYLP